MSKPDTEPAPEIEIFVNKKPVDTVGMAATRHGVEPGSMRATIARKKIKAAARLDDRTPLFLVTVIDAAMSGPGHAWRQGQGYKPKPKRTRKPAPAEWVTSDPGIRGGEPCITGTRVPASDVAALVRDGVPPARVKRYYSNVTAAAARAAAVWAADAGIQMPPSEIDSAQ